MCIYAYVLVFLVCLIILFLIGVRKRRVPPANNITPKRPLSSKTSNNTPKKLLSNAIDKENEDYASPSFKGKNRSQTHERNLVYKFAQSVHTCN